MAPSNRSGYDRPVPRYTSYPTAAQFDSSVGPVQHERWLAELGHAPASLYLHVPFCHELCWYCACHTMAMRRPGTLDAYADALMEELLQVAHTNPDLVLDSIQWGGGTPSQLGPARLRRVGRRVATLFDRRCDAEVSLELDPRHCNGEIAEAIAEIGTTRVSLGVQDFDPEVQKAINRMQSFEMTATAIGLLRAEGIKRFNIDLVYGLPHQTEQSLARTLELALELRPSRFAIFGYAHVPWMKPHQKLIDAEALPATETRAALAALAADRLVEAGYVKIGLDHYALPDDALAIAAGAGMLKRNFQGYVADRTPWSIGVGASAISSLPGGYSQNSVDVAEYLAASGKRRFATSRGIALTNDDRLRRAIIGHLMCENRVDVEQECRRFHVDREAFLASIDDLPQLEQDGLIAIDDGRLTLTPAGHPFVRFVCAAFDRHYTGAESRHSRGL